MFIFTNLFTSHRGQEENATRTRVSTSSEKASTRYLRIPFDDATVKLRTVSRNKFGKLTRVIVVEDHARRMYFYTSASQHCS